MNTNEERRKVVKEWPKYWQCESLGYVLRQQSKDSIIKFYSDKQWFIFGGPICDCDKPITPSRAFDLTGDNSILEKGGDESCVTTTKDSVQVANASPAPGETKGASLCKCGHEVGLHFYHSHGGGKTACSYPNCKCDKYESPEQPSSPAWIPVKDGLPELGKPFWGITNQGVILWDKGRSSVNILSGVSYWMYPQGIYQVPLPPQPKTQQEKDEEACKQSAAKFGYIDDKGFDSGFHAACAYVRSLDKQP